MRGARAAERTAALSVNVNRARRDAAEAAIREAQAIHDIARIGSGVIVAVQAENELEDARAEQADAQHRVARAEAQAARASAFREHRKKESDRIALLASKNAIERRVVNEQEDRYRSAQADERGAEAKVNQARASVAIAEAAVHAAEARRDLARAVSRLAGDPGAEREPEPLKAAMTRLRRARVDRARSERDAARLEVGRAEAEAERDRATVAFRTKQVERVKQLAARKAVEERLVDEHELAVDESRHLQQRVRGRRQVGPRPPRGRRGPAQGRRGRGRWQ